MRCVLCLLNEVNKCLPRRSWNFKGSSSEWVHRRLVVRCSETIWNQFKCVKIRTVFNCVVISYSVWALRAAGVQHAELIGFITFLRQDNYCYYYRWHWSRNETNINSIQLVTHHNRVGTRKKRRSAWHLLRIFCTIITYNDGEISNYLNCRDDCCRFQSGTIQILVRFAEKTTEEKKSHDKPNWIVINLV